MIELCDVLTFIQWHEGLLFSVEPLVMVKNRPTTLQMLKGVVGEQAGVRSRVQVPLSIVNVHRG